MKHLLSLAEWTPEQLTETLDLARRIKTSPAEYADALPGRILLMIFQKPSLRTRLSFEAAMLQMGGHAIHFDLSMSPWARGRESAADTARTASLYVDAIMARLFRDEDLRELAEASEVPVINGLTDLEHPCQAIGDLLTIRERKGGLAGATVAYVGDGRSNVPHSLIDGCALAGVHLRIGCPSSAEFLPSPDVLRRRERNAAATGARLDVVIDPHEAVRGADVVYTDTWMSYHIPADHREARLTALEPYRVTRALMEAAAPDAVFMHCLPAQRGAEVDAEVLDSPASIVFEQAANRLHSEKAILVQLIGRH